MDKNKLKFYAPQARRDFIASVTARAHQLGLSEHEGNPVIAPAKISGDVLMIDGQTWSKKIHDQREKLIGRIKSEGFSPTMEAVAYTWFNRFAALRYMEIHDYLGHGHRVLSNREGGLPEILSHAIEIAQNKGLPSLNVDEVRTLRLAGNRDNELYKILLVAQCNGLHKVLPILFEYINDETELLLPDNLLRTDSIITKLVEEIPEENWQEVEILGWLYQFYISEKKNAVIGKVVKSEDIPAATQLFTPNWIVQYLVQNSVGRLWLMANPGSTLKQNWPYYIEPAQQTPEVQGQLESLIQVRKDADGGTLNPETITVLDPACGSGHILVEAYEVLKAIYLERGYQPRTIPRLILERNLYGLDIDDRAAQLAGFALLMKARADDRRLFDNPLKLNVLSFEESKGLDPEEIAINFEPFGVQRSLITQLISTFEHAKTFGSLIQIPEALNAGLDKVAKALEQARSHLQTSQTAIKLLPLLEQAKLLGMQFDAVVANPPYMGKKYLTLLLKNFLKNSYKGFEKDLFSAFIIRNLTLTKESGQLGFMSPFVWMFISSYEELRLHIIDDTTLTSLVQLEYSGFDGATVPICTFTLSKVHVSGFTGSYIRLSDFRGGDQQGPKTLEAIQKRNCGWFYTSNQDDFKKIPGSPIAYWVSEKEKNLHLRVGSLGSVCFPRKGLDTGQNEVFLRLWHEVDTEHTCLNNRDHKKRWYPYNKGGDFRRWYGNRMYLINWENDGEQIKKRVTWTTQKPTIRNSDFYFREGYTWTTISSGRFSARYCPEGALFDNGGCTIFADAYLNTIGGFVNTKIMKRYLEFLSPTLNFQPGDISRVLFPSDCLEKDTKTDKCVNISKNDWDSFETSWDFACLPLLKSEYRQQTLHSTYQTLRAHWREMTQEMKRLEEENNRIFIDAYGLQGELTSYVSLSEITLTCNPNYRYGGEKTEEELESLLLGDTMRELISYSVSCMMGRYSLDEPGLIYAHSGNIGFDLTHYKTFPADIDGIVPLTDEPWFENDSTNRIREFLLTVWGAENLEENMSWLAESLGRKSNEAPVETIRRYLSDKFFKDHLKTYKKRPIYWLFSSGKQRAFQALVYLHRYHEGTLARMRSKFVVPLISRIQSQLGMLEKDLAEATSTAIRNKLNKEIEGLRKKLTELLAYDEKLRHYADMRIKLDLDDGVKVNYGKFGDLLAEVKFVTGGESDD